MYPKIEISRLKVKTYENLIYPKIEIIATQITRIPSEPRAHGRLHGGLTHYV
jgi:hypothetical protein